MTKLKRKADGRVFDCVVYEHGDGLLFETRLMAAYWDKDEERWTSQYLTCFVPAVQGIDY